MMTSRLHFDISSPPSERQARDGKDRAPSSATFTRATWALVALVLVSTATAPAFAQSRSEDDDEAHALFEAGQVAYQHGELRRALDYFQRAYELSPHPALLFNIGSTQDRLRMDEEALANLRRFLELDPDNAQAEFVRGRIRDLEAAIAERQRSNVASSGGGSSADVESTGTDDAHEAPDAHEASDAHDDTAVELDSSGTASRESADPLPAIILLSAGGALTLGAVGTLVWWLDADGRVSECNDVGCTNGASIVSERDAAIGLTIGLGVVGLAGLAVGTILAVGLGGADDEADAQAATAVCAPTLGGLACAGRF